MNVQQAVPKTMASDIVHAYHDSIESMHTDIMRRFHQIRQKYFWPGMFQEIKHYVFLS